MEALEELLETSEGPAEDELAAATLEGLGLDPARGELAFRLLLLRRIKAGPGGGAPARLLELTQSAVRLGLLPAAAAGRLRSTLATLAGRLREAGAWDPAAPLWWQPLPEPSFLEGLWQRFQADGGLALPEADAVAGALGLESGDRTLRLPRLLGPGLLDHVHRELEAAHESGALSLAREGVGASAEVTVRRTDEVCYFTGLEPGLLQAAPTTALLIQALLGPVARRLQQSLPGRPCFPPQNAMLARYPAPSRGYDAHLDNPGGERDNGRAFTLVTYLNAPENPPAGGGIALWSAPGTGGEPDSVVPPEGGSAVLFDSREVPHQVLALQAGPARWALTVWLSERPQGPPEALPVPAPTVADALLPLPDPALPADTVLLYDLSGAEPAGAVEAVRLDPGSVGRAPRLGLVATVYRAEEGPSGLEGWCEHHLRLGVDHLLLVFDHFEDPRELAQAAALARRFGDDRLTLWSGAAVAAERWAGLAPSRLEDEELWGLVRLTAGGSSSHAVAARQCLHATAALDAATTDELGGAPLDWLLHLDADEALHLEGSGRGGATVVEHLRAAEAAGAAQLRYLNHERLQVRDQPAGSELGLVGGRYKVNPRLGAARLGSRGFARLMAHLGADQDGPRPYFASYHNGKSAVAVAQGRAAAGVHGWRLAEGGGRSLLLAGPSILHHPTPTPQALVAKYRRKTRAPRIAGEVPFELSSLEQEAARLLGGTESSTEDRAAEGLFDARFCWSSREISLLEDAGLILDPTRQPSED